MDKITTTTLPTFMNTRAIGFGRVMDLIDDAASFKTSINYPPYNIIQEDDDNFIIELALAGFSEDDLNITQDGHKLIVAATNVPSDDAVEDEDDAVYVENRKYLHHGISNRAFKREFVLADYVTVSGALFENGIVSINLKRELPEAMKPRQIALKKISK